MARAFKHNKKAIQSSGDLLSDWVFGQFLHFLRKDSVRVKRKKCLQDPDDKEKCVLYGLMDDDSDESGKYVYILINAARSWHRSRDEEAKTLVHELSHIVFWNTREEHIRRIENILIKKFSSDQWACLKSFLPRHAIRRYPAKCEHASHTAKAKRQNLSTIRRKR